MKILPTRASISRQLCALIMFAGFTTSVSASDGLPAGFVTEASGRGNWAIALSGGGLRSSLYMVGALKALDEKGLVGPSRAISTVSGGGYAGYWLYNLHHRVDSGKNPFGWSALSSQHFPTRMCELMTLGNFVTNAQIARNFVAFNSVGLYHKAIRRTYGSGDTAARPLLLSDFRNEVTGGSIPLPIVNATIDKPRPLSGSHAIIEFTPTGIANARLGETIWQNASEVKLPYYRLAAISGAAVKQLKQKIDNPFGSIPARKLKLWDGGKSENLGAYALIRRGIPNVIIIDAEHDPKFGFEAYEILKNRLADDGITLTSRDLEAAIGKRPLKSFFEGVAEAPGKTTKIYYIKMSLAASLDNVLHEQSQDGSKGEGVQSAYNRALEQSDPSSKNWDCAMLDAQPLNMRPWSAFNAGRYAAYLSGKDGTARIFNATAVNFLALRFPHYSTIDQSFYVDQARAFVGLGYLQASELASSI